MVLNTESTHDVSDATLPRFCAIAELKGKIKRIKTATKNLIKEDVKFDC